MNEHSLNDPQLQSFEARLAALTPQLPAGEQQQLLYQCGYEAGRKTSRRSLRRWQAAAALLAVVMLGWRLYGEPESVVVIEKQVQPSPPAEAVFPRIAQSEIPSTARQAGPVELDAWQTPPPAHADLSDELSQFRSADPHLRSLTMASFTRAVLEN